MNTVLEVRPVEVVAARRARLRHVLPILLALFLLVHAASLFAPAVLDDADGTHANAARWMAVHHDFVTLHVDGIRYLEKAPLLYWASAASGLLFGFNAFAMHLPLALGTLGCALLARRWAREAWGERAGFYAALGVLTAFGVFLFTRVFIPETILSGLIAGALYCFARALDGGRRARGFWYGAYALSALAVLAKGLIGLVFVAVPAGLYLALTGEWRRWREFRLGQGTLLFLAIAAPWHVLAGVRNKGFFWFYFVNEHVYRFLGKRYPKDYNRLPQAAYWGLHLVWLFPWSLFVPLVIRDLRRDLGRWSAQRFRRMNFAQRTTLLCALQAGFVLVFFALSTNQEYYTFPAYLPLLLLAARSLARAEEHAGGRFDHRALAGAHAVLLGVGLAVAATLFAGLWSSRHLPYVADIGTLLVDRDVGGNTLSMTRLFDLTGSAFAALRLPAVLAALALSAGPLLAWWLRRGARHVAATVTVAFTAALFLVAAHVALVRFEPYMSSAALARVVRGQAAPADRVMIYGDQAYGSSLVFYSGRDHLELVNGRSTSLEFGSHYPDAPKIFLDDAGLLAAWRGPVRVFLFVPEEQRTRVDALLGPGKRLVAEVSGKALYSNR